MIKKSFLRQRIYSFFQLLIIFAWIILVIILDYQIITNKFYLREQKSRRFGFGLSEISFPIKAADFIEQNNLQGNFFNGYGVGGYLNWRLFPKHKTFIDGQTYTLNSLNYYYGVLRNEITIANAAKKYNINYFILNYPNQNILDLVPQFYIKEDWKLIYFDEITAIFIVNKLKNKDIINKYEIDFKTNKNMFSNNLISLKDKVNYSSGYVNRGRFFFTLELWENAKDQFLKAIEADPENYVALSNLGATYQMLGKNDLAFDALRKSIKLYSHYSSSHYNLAVWYHKKNMFDEAKKEYIKTLEINGSHSLAKYYLGLIYSSPRFSP